MRTLYPLVERKEDVLPALQEIIRLRQVEDISDFINLPQQFVSGRTTEREPSTPTDVLSSDNEGDIVINADATYQYQLVDVSGTLKWARTALDTSW